MTKRPSTSDERTPQGGLVEASLSRVLGYHLAQANIASRQIFKDRVGTPYDLRPVEYTLLTLVHENPGVSAKKLANALAVTAPNITMWVDKLESRGLVARERSAADRRAQHIRTTEAGSKLAREATAQLIESQRDHFDLLSHAELALLLELLHKVARTRKQT